MPEATWTAAAIGKHQLTMNEWALELGGHVRTGLEDNVRLNRTTLAPSNAALVKLAVEICGQYHRTVASAKQARNILGLRKAA